MTVHLVAARAPLALLAAAPLAAQPAADRRAREYRRIDPMESLRGE